MLYKTKSVAVNAFKILSLGEAVVGPNQLPEYNAALDSGDNVVLTFANFGGRAPKVGDYLIHQNENDRYVCPADVFAAKYREAHDEGLNFGQAIEALEEGKKVVRKGWNGKSMFLFLVPGSTFKVNRPPLLGIYPEGEEIQYHAHIDMKTAQGYIVPWLASQSDVLAKDWVILLD